ncbi:hypothetical protein ACFPPA_13925 [Rhodanobacter ginsengisoli]|uniref:Uncharacterized protein n=1 Tax=Rhodanobacter ginsengisoli TaxID=418646 RepID=A0ABW0QPD1_9GAMM
MTPHDQWLLMGGVVGLYLYDSALLLFHNEIVLESKRHGYLVSAGGALEIGGRYLFLPNPCCPHRLLIRLGWSAGEARDRPRPPWKRTRLALSIIAPWTWLLLGLFFVALPYALWVGTNVVLLCWLLLTYLVITAMLLHVHRHRKALNLSTHALIALAFDTLLCAPFAINIVRKISLRQVTPDLRSVASSLLSTAEHSVLTGILRRRIQTSLCFLEQGSAASDALHAYLKHVEDGTP